MRGIVDCATVGQVARVAAQVVWRRSNMARNVEQNPRRKDRRSSRRSRRLPGRNRRPSTTSNFLSETCGLQPRLRPRRNAPRGSTGSLLRCREGGGRRGNGRRSSIARRNSSPVCDAKSPHATLALLVLPLGPCPTPTKPPPVARRSRYQRWRWDEVQTNFKSGDRQ